MIRRLTYGIFTIMVALLTIGCSDTFGDLWGDDGGDMEGEPISFVTKLPTMRTAGTRATVDNDLLDSYVPVNREFNYNFAVTMKRANAETEWTGNYAVPKDTKNGVLSSTKPLYWQDNVNRYAFKAVAGTEQLQTEQSTKERWLNQDRLLGYGYEPLLGDDNQPIDNLTAYNYRTNREWYQNNRVWLDGIGLSTVEDYKRVPLFMQHQRSLITVILKAGDGVLRKDVLAETASKKLSVKIFSYDDANSDEPITINPLQGSATLHYDEEPEEDNVVARYDAIVYPHNYIEKAEDERICAINLSRQNFSFYAGNDKRYTDYKNLDDAAKEASEIYNDYNLKAGENLVLTVTLSRDSRKILITAYVQPWTDIVTSYVCNDFGIVGDPIFISNQQELEAFLNDKEKNASGNVAIVNTSFDLKNWNSNHTLNAILNLANNTITTDSRLFDRISGSGSIINGTLKLNSNVTGVNTLICNTNEGSVDRLTLGSTSDTQYAVVTRAAVAVDNSGQISNVTSALRVEGKVAVGDDITYIGGIAGVSRLGEAEGAMQPSITNCYVSAKVTIANGQDKTKFKGGGIVGGANGIVSNNNYEYGVTIGLIRDDYPIKNIMYTKLDGNDLKASANQWPTKTNNTPEGGSSLDNAMPEDDRFDGVIDCEEELKMLIISGSSYNEEGKKYRLSDSFTVLSQTWTLGKKSDDKGNHIWGNVLFLLDGNNKIITLDGTKVIEYREKSDGAVTAVEKTAPMLFCNIIGTVKDLQLNCAESLYGIPFYGTDGVTGDNKSEDICAPLAYSVIGGRVSNVKVHAVKRADNTYPKIVAAIPAGLAVWAYEGAVIENCVCDIDVEMKLAESFDNADKRQYAGGLVAQVAQATLKQCVYIPREAFTFSCNIARHQQNFCFGGIVGGTVIKTRSGVAPENPLAVFTDCSSNYSFNAQTNKYSHGAIIGYSTYVENNLSHSGINNTECQGNWWTLDNTGVGDKTSVGADEKLLGKRNAFTPAWPTLTDR